MVRPQEDVEKALSKPASVPGFAPMEFTPELKAGFVVTLSSHDCGLSIPSSSSSSSSTTSSQSMRSENFEKDLSPALPEKRGSRMSRYLFYNFFSVYRVLFAIIFMGNLGTFIGFVVKTKGAPNMTDVGNATSANLMVSILFRQEHFVNLLYEIFTCAPLSAPLVVRRALTKVFHYGGVHSGCGVAATVWYLLFVAIGTKDFVQHPSPGTVANLITSYILITMLLGILLGAHPRFRSMFHDHFEVTHRFAGWTALVVFWVHTFLAAEETRKAASESLGLSLVKSPGFWFLVVSTICILGSWTPTKQREVIPERLSDHAIRLRFNYRRMKPFCGVRVSDSPLTEWHAFATIPDNDAKGYSIVVSNAGDWTNRTIMNPPKKLYIRGSPLRNLLYGSRLFQRIVVVATGSGIGPCLSLMYADITPKRIFWSTANPEVTYGQGIMDTVRRSDRNAVIWDTRKQGRPDMVAVTHQLYVEFQAEAVFIISNPKVTRKVVYGLESRGIACYGAIFDS
ncbi:MAG: hypothetical protein M4579_003213 [Chaenotheca gracillima]|nr:MAG: hypothetical protein M4579_003213 [Chaenotheca gracillima]